MAGPILKPMAMADREGRAHGSFERRMWGDAFAELSAAHRDGQLGVEDLERLAVAAYMVGRDDDVRRRLDGRAPRVVAPRRSRSAPHAVRSGRRSGCSSGATWPRRWAGSPAAAGSWRRAAATASSRPGCGCSRPCRGCSREMQPRIRASSRRSEIAERFGDADASMFARLGRGYSLILQGRARRGHGAAGRGHGRRHGRRGVADARGHRLLPGDRPVPSGVRSPSREGVDGGAHALVRCAARPRSVPRQLSRPSLRDLPVAGRVDGRPRFRPASLRLARRPTGMGRARIGLLPAGRDPAAARRVRRGGGVLPPSQSGRTGSRAGHVAAPPGAGADRSRCCRRSAARWTRRRIRSLGHACCPRHVEVMLEAEDVGSGAGGGR